MIRYINDLFLTEKNVKKIDKIKQDIENKKYISMACFITLAKNQTDVFDIIPILNLKLKSNMYDDLLVVGIAENKKAAVRLCAEISMQYINTDTSLSMREYFERYVK